jgi:hypothetical protein
MHELIKKIEYNNGVFPRDAIKEIIDRKDEAIPYLIDIVKQVRDNPEKYKNEHKYFAHIYAVYLLAQFRVKELFPIFLDILNLSGTMPHDLFGDVICEDAGRILATVYHDDAQPIKNLITNVEADEYARGQALRALAILVLNDRMERNVVLNYYKELLNGGLEDQHPYVLAEVVVYSDELYPEEIYDEIKNAFNNDMIDEGVIGIESVNRTLRRDQISVIESSKNNTHMKLIDDTIAEIEHWACFHIDCEERKRKRMLQNKMIEGSKKSNTQTVVKDLKVGRNDPCPCGSGKKYKKCCGG